MTRVPEHHGPEPLRDQIFVAITYALLCAALLGYAPAPVTDDLGPAQTAAPVIALTPLALAVVRRRASARGRADGRQAK